jgi:hypothetical protein
METDQGRLPQATEYFSAYLHLAALPAHIQPIQHQ